MTRDEIIQLAREADMIDFRDEDSDLHVVQFVDFLASVIGKAVAAEREACAKVCEKISDEYCESEGRKYAELRTDAETGARDCESAIRARGEKG
jgi:hypothetical protein